MEFLIDSRECKLIELLSKQNQISNKWPFTTTNLNIGDIIIKKDEYQLIIERKCMTDLLASIKDGRYKEQKMRLLAEESRSNGKVRICYLIEGEMNMKASSNDKNIILGSMVSSTFRDHIPILRTYNLDETMSVILRIYDRVNKDISDFFNVKTPVGTNTLFPAQIETTIDTGNTAGIVADTNVIGTNANANANENSINKLYLQSIKKNKKENLTPNTWFIMSLMNIPGISNTIAEKIVEKYATLNDLYSAYQQEDTNEKKHQLIANIILTQNDKTTRRIGSVISKRIYEYLLFTSL
jgi:crossover junction endonuclease MUS81